MKDWEEKLDKLTATKRDSSFLKRLSRWLVSVSGNANAAQRLHAIALRTKQKD